uniref:Protein kinase domain-containing protein n=1 Tax=Acrobeloides nanus TaxID=290746 RepID=A0A914D4M9_9BILA
MNFLTFNENRTNTFQRESFINKTHSSYHGPRRQQSSNMNVQPPSTSTPPPTPPVSTIPSNSTQDYNEKLQMIKPSELNVIKNKSGILGKGEFGEVYKGTWQGQDVAVKILKNSNPITAK